MARSSRLSSKGQITVPLEIRKRLGVKAGDRLEFFVKDAQTILRPARNPDNPFLKYVGVLPAFSSIEQINAWVADMRDETPSKKSLPNKKARGKRR